MVGGGLNIMTILASCPPGPLTALTRHHYIVHYEHYELFIFKVVIILIIKITITIILIIMIMTMIIIIIIMTILASCPPGALTTHTRQL